MVKQLGLLDTVKLAKARKAALATCVCGRSYRPSAGDSCSRCRQKAEREEARRKRAASKNTCADCGKAPAESALYVACGQRIDTNRRLVCYACWENNSRRMGGRMFAG